MPHQQISNSSFLSRLWCFGFLLFWIDLDVASEELPAGVPRVINSDGSIDVPMMFTSPAYEEAAFRLLLSEAQSIATELGLPEKENITAADVIRRQINPFGFSFMEKKIGTITTDQYFYVVGQSNKFSSLIVNNYDKICNNLRSGEKVPLSRLDTNTPFLLATQWLTAISIDVDGLNRECQRAVAISPFWNGLQKLGGLPQRSRFVPIYVVWWQSERNRREGSGSSAFVEVYLPEKQILQIVVKDARYILRKPLTLTNLAELFSGVGKVETNVIPPLKIIRDSLPN